MANEASCERGACLQPAAAPAVFFTADSGRRGAATELL